MNIRQSLPIATADLIFQVTPNPSPMPVDKRQEVLDKPVFGTVFTDHMVDICWSETGGWHRPRVQPYGPIPLDPAAVVLHYGREIFEGMKAYRHSDDSIWTFRPEANAQRMQRSASRMAMPELPVDTATPIGNAIAKASPLLEWIGWMSRNVMGGAGIG